MKRQTLLILPPTLALFFVALLLSAVTTPTARANVLTVTTNADSGPGSLREAIAIAADGDEITFDSAYTITLISPLNITTSLTIDGGGQVTIHGLVSYGSPTTNLVSVPAGVTVTLQGLTMTNGVPGIINSGTLTLSNITLAYNSSRSASRSGGALENSGFLTILTSTFQNNGAMIDGGAIANAGTMVITNSTFSQNLCSDGGGAIANEPGGWVSIVGSTFSNNWIRVSGPGSGGAIANMSNSTLTIVNSTFVSNTIGDGGFGGWGGAIRNLGSLMLYNSTFSGNGAGAGSALYNTGAATLYNTLLANHAAGAAENCSGNLTDGGHNLDDGTSCGLGAASGSLSNTLPLLGPLGDYGGSTLTLPLLPGSPAIDAGNGTLCADVAQVNSLDQRGLTRPATCDIGAFESRSFTLTKSSGDNQRAIVNMAFTYPLAVSVTSAYAEPVNGGVVTFVGPLAGAGGTPLTATISIVNGAASQNFTANGLSGTYPVSVSTAGAPVDLAFNLTNVMSQIFLPLLKR